MKKLIFFLSFFLLSSLSWATTYYVRPDGGTNVQCTGLADAAYPGSGSAQACAFIHPKYPLGYDCQNFGNSCTHARIISGGDTVFIKGDNADGSQAQYMVGYPGSGSDAHCATTFTYDCTLGNLPSGTDASHPTRLIGTGTNYPQLWGTERVWQVLNAHANHLDIENLDITDHSTCFQNATTDVCNSGTYPHGPWADDGIEGGGDDDLYKNINVHGLARYGMHMESMVNVTFTNVKLIANGQGNETDTTATLTGTLTWNQPYWDWNGCSEKYPLVATLDDPSNVQNCQAQNDHVIADAFAIGSGPTIDPGNWIINGPGSISFNTQDGLDLLHAKATGSVKIWGMKFEGNAGQTIKINALVQDVENNILFGDCGWWSGAAQSAPGMKWANASFCRAGGDTIVFGMGPGVVVNFYNNTVISYGNVALESSDAFSYGCDANTHIHSKNNIIMGGWDWQQDFGANPTGAGDNRKVTYIYNDGIDGNGRGTCGAITWDEDYNIVSSGFKSLSLCVGAHDQCGVDPKFIGTIPVGHGSDSSYYQGTNGASLTYIQSSSPARSAASSSLTYWNSSSDFNNNTRPPWDIGALIYNSTPSSGVTPPTCFDNGTACSVDNDCCSVICSGGMCASSRPTSPQNILSGNGRFGILGSIKFN